MSHIAVVILLSFLLAGAFSFSEFVKKTGRPTLEQQIIQDPYFGVEPPSLSLSDYETHPASKIQGDKPQYTVIKIDRHQYKQNLTGVVVIVDNPLKHFAIHTSPKGCPGRNSTSETAAFYKCTVATNAGFFNVQTGDCIGNIVSNSKVVQMTAKTNANFGLTEHGDFITGYLTENDVKQKKFTQLVTGVIWLVRHGRSYVDEADHTEKPNAGFVPLLAPRVAIGHDRIGRLMFVEVNGYRPDLDRPGINLWQFAEILLEFGAVSAINLDGGGSSTVIERNNQSGTFEILSSCTDACTSGSESRKCPNTDNRCQRGVTTITCLV